MISIRWIGVHLRVQVAHPDPHLEQVVGQVLGHLLGERGDEHPLPGLGALADLLDQVVDLAPRGPDLDLGVDETGRAHDLLGDAGGRPELVGAGRGRHVDDLLDLLHELLEPQRPVVHRARQAEPELDERLLARHVALVHPVDLRHRDVRLVDHAEPVVGEVVEQRVRRLTRCAAVDVARVVLDARAEPDLAEHLEVVVRAHPQALGLEELALALEQREPLVELLLDRDDGPLHPLVRGDVVRRREHRDLGEVSEHLAGERVEPRDPLDRVAPPLDPDRGLLVRRDDLEGVALDAELARGRGSPGSAGTGCRPGAALRPVHVGRDALVDPQDLALVLLGRAQAVDAGDARHDQDVAPRQQRRGRRVPQALDLVVDRRVLLDVGVGLRDVRLGLVVVVVGDEVLHGVLGEDLAELVRELGGRATCSAR